MARFRLQLEDVSNTIAGMHGEILQAGLKLSRIAVRRLHFLARELKGATEVCSTDKTTKDGLKHESNAEQKIATDGSER